MKAEKSIRNTSALRKVASSAGVVAGIGGMEHGILEMLQGNVTTSGKVIESIGAAQRFWVHGSEPAFTLISNFLVTGIMAMAVGLMVIIWSAAFIDRKYGALVLLCLSIIMFLVGGGFAPPVFAIVAILAAILMNKQFRWLRTHIPEKLIFSLAKLWAIALIPFIILSVAEIITAIFGYPLLWFFPEDSIVDVLMTFGNVTFFGLGPIVLITALAHDMKYSARQLNHIVGHNATPSDTRITH
jgi:hypothetical protein